MHLTNYTFFNPKNYLYTNPIKGLRGYGLSYRFTFNGKENDEETQTQDYGFRIYDYRLGKFLTVDPLTKSYPFYSPYQSAGNTPIMAIDKDGAEPEFMVSKQGKLTAPILILFNAFNSVQLTTMLAINITKGGAEPGHNADTWNETTIITSPENRSDEEWMSTLFHEVKHVEEFKKSKLPASLLRMSHSIQDFFSGSVISEWHTDAFNAGSHMTQFIKENPNILERIKNKTITGKEIKIAAYSFNIKQLDYKIKGLVFKLNKANKKVDKEAVESLQKKIDNLNQQKSEQTKKLEETKDEK